jgi:hypothetical protein
MYACGARETRIRLTTLIYCPDKMLKEANMTLISGLFEAVYVNGESISLLSPGGIIG